MSPGTIIVVYVSTSHTYIVHLETLSIGVHLRSCCVIVKIDTGIDQLLLYYTIAKFHCAQNAVVNVGLLKYFKKECVEHAKMYVR